MAVRVGLGKSVFDDSAVAGVAGFPSLFANEATTPQHIQKNATSVKAAILTGLDFRNGIF